MSDEPPLEDQDNEDEETVRLRGVLTHLKLEHRDLNAAIEALESLPLPDQLQIARLKKRKLALKDQMAKIEDQLTPDLIA